jgi:hypothetical protein
MEFLSATALSFVKNQIFEGNECPIRKAKDDARAMLLPQAACTLKTR